MSNEKLSEEEILKLAKKEMDDYIDMGCFQRPEDARPYLIDGFQLGYKYNQLTIDKLQTDKEVYDNKSCLNCIYNTDSEENDCPVKDALRVLEDFDTEEFYCCNYEQLIEKHKEGK
jgi:hypothetical protein